jgi:hypothetical protein
MRPESRDALTEMPIIAGQRLEGASVTRGNVADSHTPGNNTPETHRRFRRAFLCDGTAIVGPLFGDFGEALVRMGWPPGALFDVPHDDRPGGLVWFLEGETVRALGPKRAFTETGRIFDRKRTFVKEVLRQEMTARVRFEIVPVKKWNAKAAIIAGRYRRAKAHQSARRAA